ncbi:hypothetical protein PEBR_16546 [Penicillium brasilianum]|uniref:F-box domain-containing protein n=1 Tax=Penicillium brasilianum TaxID=104259 RepID=A0A1S9RQJ8_PENBI|nr:hypothetical protein PEBR_16546 [Penicillium brasilianum]
MSRNSLSLLTIDLQCTTETPMTSSMMGLLDLTNELLFEIIQVLGYGWDLTAFGVTNRRLHALVNPHLYQRALPNYRNAELEWLVETANEAAFVQCLKANIPTYVEKPAKDSTAKSNIPRT